ncbi:MAG: FIG187021: hypothetical protein, partial [uncultured Pseudonocardia sp.]
ARSGSRGGRAATVEPRPRRGRRTPAVVVAPDPGRTDGLPRRARPSRPDGRDGGGDRRLGRRAGGAQPAAAPGRAAAAPARPVVGAEAGAGPRRGAVLRLAGRRRRALRRARRRRGVGPPERHLRRPRLRRDPDRCRPADQRRQRAGLRRADRSGEQPAVRGGRHDRGVRLQRVRRPGRRHRGDPLRARL